MFSMICIHFCLRRKKSVYCWTPQGNIACYSLLYTVRASMFLPFVPYCTFKTIQNCRCLLLTELLLIILCTDIVDYKYEIQTLLTVDTTSSNCTFYHWNHVANSILIYVCSWTSTIENSYNFSSCKSKMLNHRAGYV